VFDTESLAILLLGVVLLVVVVLLSLRFLRQYRLRRVRELREEGSGRATAGDRAYNRLALARREADLLAAQGGDVGGARQLIDLANQALDRREVDRAYELAQAAHETLVKARREPRSGRPQPSVTPDPVSTVPLPAAAVPAAGSDPSPGSPAALAKGRAEAQFQLHLFEDELARGSKSGAPAPALAEAKALYVQAHSAFSRSEYAEAFRLSLRGRRRIGGHVESLAAGPGATSTPAPGGPAESDLVRAAEGVAGQERCAQCGHPTVPGDAFCRGCGAARTATACPKCGAPRLPADTFCGKCGERYRPSAT
jgi:hypothetical protein